MTFINKGGVILKIEGNKEELVTKFKTQEFKKNANNIVKNLNIIADHKPLKEQKKAEVKETFFIDKYKSKFV